MTSIAEIHEILDRTARHAEESARRAEEANAAAEKQMAELRALLAEAARRDEESARREAEWKREREKLDAEYKREREKLDAEYKAAEEKRKKDRERRDAEYKAAKEKSDAEWKRERAAILHRMKTERLITDETIRKSVNSFDLKWGMLVESFVSNQAVELFVERGIPVTDGSAKNICGKIAGKSAEIDVALVNSDVAVAIEVKTRLHKSDVNRFLYVLKYIRCFKFFAPYDTIYGAIAYIRADDSIVEYAQSRG
ncbi:MAG: hypothetical protein ACRC46_09825, partial [Thermoguttaceae bacterium]